MSDNTFYPIVLPDLPDSEKMIRLSQITLDIKTRLKRTAEDVFKIGEQLYEVKEVLLQHGQYLAWLHENFTMDDRTAQRYVNVYLEFRTKYDSLSYLPVSILHKLAESSTPKSAIDPIVELLTGGNKVTGKEADQIIEKHKYGLTTAAQIVDTLAPEAIKDKVAKGEIGVVLAARALQTAPYLVIQVAKQWGVVDPGVIEVLTSQFNKMPDEWESSARSGTMNLYTPNGCTPIALSKLDHFNARQAYISQRREESIIEHQATSPQPIVDTEYCFIDTVEKVKADHSNGPAYLVTLRVDEEAYRKLKAEEKTSKRLIIKRLTR